MNDDPQRPCRRHDWQPQPPADDPEGLPAGYTCARCPATAHPCGTCGRPLEHASARTCDRCISDARNTVRDIRDLYHALPDVIAAVAGLHAIRYDRGGTTKPTRGGKGTDTTILGGAALVMAGPGATGNVHIDPALYALEARDPKPVLAVLVEWEDAWRAEQHQHAADTTTVAAAVEYLVVHTAWAAQHSPTWGEYVKETRDLRWRLRILTGDDRRPVKAGVPCPYCAGTIVQHWRDVDPKKPGSGGLEDVRRCSVCGLTWASEAHFRMALREAHAELPDRKPDELVTLDDAKRIFKERGVRPNLLDLWVHRGVLQPAVDADGRARRDVRGAALYRLGDIAARCRRTVGESAS